MLFSAKITNVVLLHTDVYLTVSGTVIPNNGYVDISDIGFTDEGALLCHTNRPPPPGGINSGGNWCAPDGTRVNNADVAGVTLNRTAMVVRLMRFPGTPAEGIYTCFVLDDASTLTALFVGLYNTGGGTHFLIMQ